MTEALPPQADAKAVVQAPQGKLAAVIRDAWNPVPVPPPTLDLGFESLPTTERLAETIRYTALDIEHSLSPGGSLRAWLKLNAAFAILIAIPALLVLPVITFALGQFESWAQSMFVIAFNLMLAIVALAIGTAVVMATHALWTWYWGRKRHRRR